MISDWLGQANGGFIDNVANASTIVPTSGTSPAPATSTATTATTSCGATTTAGSPTGSASANGGFVDNAANGSTRCRPHGRSPSIGDYNGDDRDDILWRHDDGRLTDWLGLANGGFLDNAANALTGVPTQWHVQAYDLPVV